MAQANYLTTQDPLSLDRIRNMLIRLEDTIIFALIERAQFAHNPKIYARGAFPQLKEAGFDGSWLEWFLKETETFHAQARRYTSPDEYPFTTSLPQPLLAPLAMPRLLHPNTINVNPSILSFYVYSIVPAITRQASIQLSATKRACGITGPDEFDDDGNYGSVATIDVQILQAISKRVHYGKFVSESKFRSHPADFIPHILNPNPAALDALITKPAVEKALLERLVKKAKLYGRDIGPDGEPREDGWKIDVQTVKDLYEKYIIPLTKEVEVDYLLRRLDGLSDEEVEALATKGMPPAHCNSHANGHQHTNGVNKSANGVTTNGNGVNGHN
ncbi:chorismate mutase [Exidia glandulosa HHB12029]|uniref:Chorismate mutase n=1 Tax=Exidia glandulosa HHB12029 TaxID=1314781 RepID=A0A165FFS7_EXIGL|nr:chorismate mutase [Exidia glandulosa HHB12029]